MTGSVDDTIHRIAPGIGNQGLRAGVGHLGIASHLHLPYILHADAEREPSVVAYDYLNI